MAEDLPLRDCDGCGKEPDDHPRVQYDTGARVLLFHYDCAPNYVLRDHPELQVGLDATANGKRGDDVRAAVVAANDKNLEG